MQNGVFQMVITDVRMESEDAGFEVVRAARLQSYDPATAMLTAYPPRSGNWSEHGADSLLVKPVGTEDLVRQVEALLIQHEDAKRASPPGSAKSLKISRKGSREKSKPAFACRTQACALRAGSVSSFLKHSRQNTGRPCVWV